MSNKQWRMPDTYVIIFFIVLLAAVLTYVVPTGFFNVSYVVMDDQEATIAVVEDNTVMDVTVNGTVYTIDATDGSRTYVFSGEEEVGNIRKSKASALELEGAIVVQEYAGFQSTGETKAIKVFEKWGDVGFLNYMFEGLVTGDKWGSAVGSGSIFRGIMWAVFTALGIIFTMYYGKRIKKDPKSSLAYESDAAYREEFSNKTMADNPLKLGHGLVLLTILLGIIWTIWGVQQHGYYIPEIATVFFTMGLVSGIIGVIFKLNQMTVNSIAESFKDGAKDLVGAALVVGMAQGIVLVLGHSSANSASVLNTILNGMANSLDGVPAVVTGWLMYVMQSIFNFFVVSGSGQAALTMPLMAPLAELLGVTKQVAVLAFQLGDGFTNLIVPTSGCLMGVLGVARLDWNKWFKFQWKFQAVLFAVGSVFIVVAVMIGLS